jgi:syntaxin 5
VADAEANVDQAHGELMTMLSSVSSDRWLMMKIFGIVLVFFLFFVVFVA